MKNNLKKLSIMFLMAFGIILGNYTNAFATESMTINNTTGDGNAKIGDQVTEAQYGWKRYDDTDSNILYNDDWTFMFIKGSYKGKCHASNEKTKQVQFAFTGSKLRILSDEASNRSKSINIEIDGESKGTFSMYKDTTKVYPQAVCYQIFGLSEGEHKVRIYDTTTGCIAIDAIDIDETGELISYKPTIGETSLAPEAGWTRYDDDYPNITYNEDFTRELIFGTYNKTHHLSNQSTTKQLQFGFNGSKIRIIGNGLSDRSKSVKIEIDGKIVDTFSMYNDTTGLYTEALYYEKTNLTYGKHTVIIYDTTTGVIDIDAIDIDDTGDLLDYDEALAEIK